MTPVADPVDVRPVQSADAAALGEVHVRAWQVGYRQMMPDDYLDALRVADRVSMWERVLSAPPADFPTTLVAEVDGRVIGFIGFGEWRADEHGAEIEAGVGELQFLNVHPDAWGRGAGRALLAAAVEGLAADGYSAAVLWVVRGNTRARRFYEIGGWSPDGAERVDEIQNVTVDEVRYRTSLPPV